MTWLHPAPWCLPGSLLQYHLREWAQVWCGGLWGPSVGPYRYHLTTFLLLIGVSQWHIIPLTTYYSATVMSSLVAFSALPTEVHSFRFSCSACIILSFQSGYLSPVFVWVRTWYFQKTVFDMSSYSRVTKCGWRLSTLYNSDSRHSNLLNQQFAILLAAIDAIVAMQVPSANV